jgi:hypothetical protein
MESPELNSTTNQRLAQLIWNIADDVLRDLYVRGKYRDVILPMTVLRRLDSVLATGPDPVEWTPHKRECSLWQDHVGSSLLCTKTRP